MYEVEKIGGSHRGWIYMTHHHDSDNWDGGISFHRVLLTDGTVGDTVDLAHNHFTREPVAVDRFGPTASELLSVIVNQGLDYRPD